MRERYIVWIILAALAVGNVNLWDAVHKLRRNLPGPQQPASRQVEMDQAFAYACGFSEARFGFQDVPFCAGEQTNASKYGVREGFRP